MPTFAPVYRPQPQQQSFLTQKRKLESRKRKRKSDSDSEDEDDNQSSPTSSPPPRAGPYPLSKKDPYYIAGLSREDPLPPRPFPHAAIKESAEPKRPIQEELASLNPPIYVSGPGPEDKPTGRKRRHLDNLTTILHTCMLRGDWKRAERAWSIIIRTKIGGRGIDIRRHDRWGIGAELLMRRKPASVNVKVEPADDEEGEDESASNDTTDRVANPFSNAGFQLARKYYERLILQYPHTARTQHLFNATAIYPALFNIWIYEVQDRSKRARQALDPSDSNNASSDDASASSPAGDHRLTVQRIRAVELEEALPIAQRMDELMLSPPYDTHATLLEMRGMVALWLADLHEDVAKLRSEDVDTSMTSEPTSPVSDASEEHRRNAEVERQKAVSIFTRLKARGVELPDTISNNLLS